MRNSVDVRTLLSVYEKVKTQGQRKDNQCKLEDITCTESLDGYSVNLADNSVSLDINFHNTYHFHTDNDNLETVINQTTADVHNNNEAQVQDFLKKLMALDQHY